MKRDNLYFLAIVLPPEVCKQVVEIERYIAGKYNSHRSLKIIPHITLKAPFKLEAEKHHRLLQWFSSLSIEIPAFELELRNFGSFQNKHHPVIFINPTPKQELYALQLTVLDQFCAGFPEVNVMNHELHFKPHVTVAYRDLTPPMFVLAWDEFSQASFYEAFSMKDFHLLQHDGVKWNTIARFALY